LILFRLPQRRTERTIAPVVGSPAVDQGKSFGLTSDQRGQRRPNDIVSIPNANGGDGSDIGAYEGDPVQVSPRTVTSTSDANDGFCGMGDCSLREAVSRANLLLGNDTITFAPNVTGTIQFQAGDASIAVSDSLTINGPGARLLVINALSQTRVFQFTGGRSYVSGLTITGGLEVAAGGSGEPAGNLLAEKSCRSL
jgi:CSLREA domain-containing protein